MTKVAVASWPASSAILRTIEPMSLRPPAGRPAAAGRQRRPAAGSLPSPTAGVAWSRLARFQEGERQRAHVVMLVALAGRRSVKTIGPAPILPHGAGRLVDDLQPGRLALELAHVEAVLPHVIVVVAGRRAHDFAVDEQIDARLARMIAAADPEADELALDRERLAGRACRCGRPCASTLSPGAEACELTTRGPFAADVALVGGNVALQDRPLAEGVAGHGPAFVGLLLEILEDDVGPRRTSPSPRERFRFGSPAAPGFRSDAVRVARPHRPARCRARRRFPASRPVALRPWRCSVFLTV